MVVFLLPFRGPWPFTAVFAGPLTASATTGVGGPVRAASVTVPDPLDVGTALPPSRDVPAVESRQSKSPRGTSGSSRRLGASATQGDPSVLAAFATSGFRAVVTPGAPTPYELTVPLTKDRQEPSTPAGVPLRYINGKAYDHPSNQAVWGIQQLESYRLVGDRSYLDRGRAAHGTLSTTASPPVELSGSHTLLTSPSTVTSRCLCLPLGTARWHRAKP